MITNNSVTFGKTVADIVREAKKIDPYIDKQISRLSKGSVCYDTVDIVQKTQTNSSSKNVAKVSSTASKKAFDNIIEKTDNTINLIG